MPALNTINDTRNTHLPLEIRVEMKLHAPTTRTMIQWERLFSRLNVPDIFKVDFSDQFLIFPLVSIYIHISLVPHLSYFFTDDVFLYRKIEFCYLWIQDDLKNRRKLRAPISWFPATVYFIHSLQGSMKWEQEVFALIAILVESMYCTQYLQYVCICCTLTTAFISKYIGVTIRIWWVSALLIMHFGISFRSHCFS